MTNSALSLGGAAHEAVSDDDYAEQDDYTVEKILAQRPKASAPEGLEFKVRWRGYRPSHDTWEPVSSFVPRILATLQQGNESMYSNTSGYVHMGLRLDWGKGITGQ